MRRKATKFLLGTFGILLLGSGAAFGQATAQISGRVTDPTGAVLPGVEVTVTQTSTGLSRTAVTNETGAYTFPNLPVGPYRLEAALPGFRTFVQTGITLQVDARLTVDPLMQVGEVAETIEVQANAAVQVETRSMSIAEVMESERILELPLAARQVTDLITLSGAAVETSIGAVGAMVTGVSVNVAGGGNFGVEYTLDGAMHNNRFFDSNMPMPFPDALAEFRLNTSTQETNVARGSGASVNSVTRSGTNEFHGNAFWFVRNAVFNAREATADERDPLKRNQLGGTIGGPILRNRLFFFSGYQSTILREAPSSTLAIVPTAAMLNGDWTTFNSCFNPRWRDADFADNSVDPSRYSSAAVRLAGRLPAAENECGELRFGAKKERHEKQTVSRIDFQQTPNHLIFGRFMATLHDQPPASSADNILTITNGARGSKDRAYQTAVGSTWVISPNTVNSFRFAYNRIDTNFQALNFFGPEEVGINIWTGVPGHFGLGVDDHFSFGAGQAANRKVRQNQWQVGNDLSLSRGAHQFGFGATWARDDIDSVANTRSVGGISIGPDFTGNAMGDFLLGRVDQIRQSMPSGLSLFQHYVGLYAHDTWRATPRLTLNAGVRWEPFFPAPWTENELGGIRVYRFSVDAFKAGQKSAVFPTAPAGFTYPSQSEDGSGPADIESAAALPVKWNQFAPRVGLAWDPTGEGRTSVRASYGLAYDTIGLRFLLNANNVSPWSGDIIHRNGTVDNPWQGNPGGNPFPFDFRTDPRFLDGSVFLPFDTELDQIYVQSWNLAVQQELAGQWRVSLSYMGRQSVNLWGTEAVNPALVLNPQSHPGLFTGPNTCVLEGRAWTPCNRRDNINQRRELRLWAAQNNPDRLADARLFSNIDMWKSGRTANYHGLLTSVRGTVGGVTLNANHTWSHCISDRTTLNITNPNNTPHNPETRDRANCGEDRRHLFNLTGVVNTPRFANPGLRALASDWRVSVITRISSGEPQTITAGTDVALTGLGGQVANQLQEDIFLDKSGDLGSVRYNRAAFAAPASGTFGNMGFLSVTGIPTWTLDLALSRVFRFGETQRFEVRAEAFNLPNAVRANDPTGNIRSGNFGKITSVRDPRIMQFALKYVF